MRIPSVLLCCAFLIINYKTINGQLIKDFFGKIHETAQKVRQDIRQVLIPKTERDHINTTNNTSIFFDDNGNSRPYQVNPVSSTTIKSASSSTLSPISTTTGKQPAPTNDNIIFVFGDDDKGPSRTDISSTNMTNEPGNTADVIVFATEKAPSTTTNKNDTADDDDKGSRENFSAGCLTGYLRTPDGRCMPPF